jgi:hypothetical protein
MTVIAPQDGQGLAILGQAEHERGPVPKMERTLAGDSHPIGSRLDGEPGS